VGPFRSGTMPVVSYVDISTLLVHYSYIIHNIVYFLNPLSHRMFDVTKNIPLYMGIYMVVNKNVSKNSPLHSVADNTSSNNHMSHNPSQ